MIRITIDLDTKNKLKISYYFLKSFFTIKKIKRIDLRQSFKKGYHLIIFTNYPYKIKEQFNLREKLGDDKTRLRLDKNRTLGRNTLFNKKIYFKNYNHFEKFLTLKNEN